MIDWKTAPEYVFRALKDGLESFQDYRILWSYQGYLAVANRASQKSSPNFTPEAKAIEEGACNRWAGGGLTIGTPVGTTQPTLPWPEARAGNATFARNFLATPWVPQSSVLADSRTVVFVSHGGLKSWKEALCGAVPSLFIPCFAEQSRNALLGTRLGFSRALDKFALSPGGVREAVADLLATGSVRAAAARRVRAQWRDAIVSDLEEATHRLGLILRFQGLPKMLRSRAAELSSLVFFSADLFAALCLALLCGAKVLA